MEMEFLRGARFLISVGSIELLPLGEMEKLFILETVKSNKEH